MKNFLLHSDTRISRQYIDEEREHVALAAEALYSVLDPATRKQTREQSEGQHGNAH